MKNALKVSALALLMLIANTGFSTPKSTFNSIKELVKEKVVYPFFYELDETSEVLVEYEVGESGVICITKVIAPNKDLKKYVLNSFDGQVLSNNQYYGTSKKVMISFIPAITIH
jgi:hypothetical protein